MTDRRKQNPDIHTIHQGAKKAATPTQDDFRVTFIQNDGDFVTKDDYTVAAKIVLNTKNNTEQYFIKSCHGELYNPEDYEMVRRSQITEMEHIWRWIEVSRAAIESYLTFLKTRNASYYSMASRECE